MRSFVAEIHLNVVSASKWKHSKEKAAPNFACGVKLFLLKFERLVACEYSRPSSPREAFREKDVYVYDLLPEISFWSPIWSWPQMIIYAYFADYAKLKCSRLRHEYGIYGRKSQTSFSRNATRAGNAEGGLCSHARLRDSRVARP